LDRSTTLKYRVTHPRSSSRYETFTAVRDVSFDVPEGQFLGIIGANGCGKSTLLKILSRIYQADTGTVEVSGKVSPFLELGVGFNPELSARENVFLNGAVLGLTRAELRGRVDDVIAFAELSDFADMKLKNYSSGMQVRLAFSVAIQAESDILLMDEVLAVGDERFVEKCFDVFARYKREGRTVVLVTHDLSSVNLYCDRALLLDHGSLLADGDPRAVTSEYRRMVGAQSDAEAAPVDTTVKVHRWGIGGLEITGTRFLRQDGTPHNTFTTGEKMIIEIAFLAHRDVGEFTCGMSIDRSDGLGLALPNFALDGRFIPCPQAGEAGKIYYEMPALGLLQASYVLTVALTDPSAAHTFDRIEGEAGFRVMDEKGRAGMVELGGEWSVGEPPQPFSKKRESSASAAAAKG